jgi:hemerythrin superfamily protein
MANPKKTSAKAKAGEPSKAKVSPSKAVPTEAAGSQDAVTLLEQDHRSVEELFARFEQTEGDAEKRQLVIAICIALKVHARLEEDLFYPAASTVVDAELLQEAQVEHASAKDLISQIETAAPGEPLYDARVKVLSEYVAHHVKEEEGEIFPRCRKSGLDLEALGRQIAFRKQELSLGLVISNPVQGFA